MAHRVGNAITFPMVYCASTNSNRVKNGRGVPLYGTPSLGVGITRRTAIYYVACGLIMRFFMLMLMLMLMQSVCVSRAPNDPGEDDGPSAVLLTWRLCPGAATDLRRQLAGPVGSTTCPSLV